MGPSPAESPMKLALVRQLPKRLGKTPFPTSLSVRAPRQQTNKAHFGPRKAAIRKSKFRPSDVRRFAVTRKQTESTSQARGPSARTAKAPPNNTKLLRRLPNKRQCRIRDQSSPATARSASGKSLSKKPIEEKEAQDCTRTGASARQPNRVSLSDSRSSSAPELQVESGKQCLQA